MVVCCVSPVPRGRRWRIDAVTGRVGLAGVGDDPVRQEIDQRPARLAEAVRQQRQVVAVAPAEVVDEQVRHRQDDQEQPDDRGDHEQGKDDDDGEDRQRRADQQPDEDDGRHLDAAERAGGYLACHEGVRLELLGPGCEWGGIGHGRSFAARTGPLASG